jgi:phosphoribosylglycinamide formyltransferase 1
MALRLGYLASGAGSGAKGIHSAISDGHLDVVSAVMISNNSGSLALRWARDGGVPTAHLSSLTHERPDELDEAMCDVLKSHRVDLVILSGYAKLVGPLTLATFHNRMLNVHPAPLPRFGGRGMYGLAVHQAVLDSGVTESAVTIHLLNEHYDQGPVVASYPVPVLEADTAASLRTRVHAAEPACYVDVLARLLNGELDLACCGDTES